MGSTDSANHEWIELYNDGANAVDVSGWTLADATNLSIELAGSITAGEYVVLERSSDASAPGSAFLIYTGALVNTGTTLSLRRADGGLEDQVAGGDAWENIGGDNTTKETAQYTTSGWQTAPSTPGAANPGVTLGTANPATSSTGTKKSGGSSGNKAVASKRTGTTTVLTLPPNTLLVDVEAKDEVFVREETSFTAASTNVGGTIAASVEYAWNFGDGTTKTGKQVAHRYQFPGTYLVTVYGSYKRQEYVATHEITVLPVDLSLTRNQSGDLQIHNDALYEMDVSGYRVVGTNGFQFAANSFILPLQTVTLASHVIGGPVSVHDTAGQVVVREGGELAVTVERPVVQNQAINAAKSVVSHQASDKLEVVVEEQPTPNEDMIITIGGSEAVTDSAEPSGREQTVRWPYLGLAALILIGWLGLAVRW